MSLPPPQLKIDATCLRLFDHRIKIHVKRYMHSLPFLTMPGITWVSIEKKHQKLKYFYLHY